MHIYCLSVCLFNFPLLHLILYSLIYWSDWWGIRKSQILTFIMFINQTKMLTKKSFNHMILYQSASFQLHSEGYGSNEVTHWEIVLFERMPMTDCNCLFVCLQISLLIPLFTLLFIYSLIFFDLFLVFITHLSATT